VTVRRSRFPLLQRGEAANKQKLLLILELGWTTEARGDLVGAGVLTPCTHTSGVGRVKPFRPAPKLNRTISSVRFRLYLDDVGIGAGAISIVSPQPIVIERIRT
jgi:hypothetical protein